MPELPEVETIRKDIERLAIGKTISAADVIEPRSVRNKPPYFKKCLTGGHFVKMERKGKLLIMELSNGNFLLARLGMTGQLIYSREHLPAKHLRAMIRFEDGSILSFNDIRKFGYLFLATCAEKDSIASKIGMDPLDQGFSPDHFRSLLENKKGILEAFLLDQKIISGIGNIYADEICFRSKLKPDRKIESLNDKDIKKLYNSTIEIISLAVKHRGTSFSDYVDAEGKKENYIKRLNVYQREKEHCKNCRKRSRRPADLRDIARIARNNPINRF